jgi:hypothetical protein
MMNEFDPLVERTPEEIPPLEAVLQVDAVRLTESLAAVQHRRHELTPRERRLLERLRDKLNEVLG